MDAALRPHSLTLRSFPTSDGVCATIYTINPQSGMSGWLFTLPVGRGRGVNLLTKNKEPPTPTPNPSPHSQRNGAARGGGEQGSAPLPRLSHFCNRLDESSARLPQQVYSGGHAGL